jgi:hypothetical protein
MVQNFEVTSDTFKAVRNCTSVTISSQKKKSVNNSNRFIGLYSYIYANMTIRLMSHGWKRREIQNVLN